MDRSFPPTPLLPKTLRSLAAPVVRVLPAVLLLAGSGRLRAEFSLSAPQPIGMATWAAEISTGDINNDGFDDFVLLNRVNAPHIRVVLSDGDRTFTVVPEPPGSVAAEASELADMNGDGKLDLLLSDSYAGDLRVYTGNGDGTFLAPAIYEGVGDYVNDITVGDFNRDGIPDAAANSLATGGVRIYYFNASGTLASTNVLGGDSNFGNIEGLVSADFDADGSRDLFVGALDGTVRKIAYKLYEPIISLGTVAVPDFGGVYRVDAADILRNGKAGFAITERGGHKICVSREPMGVGGRVYFTSNLPYAVRLADLNGDRYPDLIVGSQDPTKTLQTLGRVEIYLNDGQGGFHAPQFFATDRSEINAIGLADLTGSGKLDLVVGATPYGADTMAFYNTSPIAPQFTSAISATFTAGQSGSFAFKAQGSPGPAFTTTSTLPANVTLSSAGVLSGTPPQEAAGIYPIVVTASNGIGQSATQIFTLAVQATAPTVSSPFFNSVSSRSVNLGGSADNDNGHPITRRGVVYARTADNATPRLGGTGVSFNDDPVTTVGSFMRTVTDLTPSTLYSFAAYATNSQGTNYSQVVTFQTNPPPGSGSLVVTTLGDEYNGTSDPGQGSGTSLREAIAYANELGGTRDITFSPNLFANGPATIQTGLLQFSNVGGMTRINGPGADKLTIDGTHAGRIFNITQGGATLKGLTITRGGSNQAIGGYGDFFFSDCVFSNCTGGVIYVGGGTVLERCTFSGNSTPGNGGAIVVEGTLRVYNSTFHGNSAQGSGGAIYNMYGGAWTWVSSCTFTGNSAEISGGGLGIATGNLFMSNTILSGNSAPVNPNLMGNANPNFTHNLIDVDPATIFATGLPVLHGGTIPVIALKPGSPAIDAGSQALAVDQSGQPLATDQRGRARFAGATIDIGSYEVAALAEIGPATVSNITPTTATFSGNVTSGEPDYITRRGVVFAATSQNATPAIEGANVVTLDAAGTAGAFSLPAGGLAPLTWYSFATFVGNDVGTSYSTVQTFRTLEAQGLVVTTAAETVDAYDGQTSLKEAILFSNSNPDFSAITFAPELAGQTLQIAAPWSDQATASAFLIQSPLSITGPAAGPGVSLHIPAGNRRRHFAVETGAELTLANLTITGGDVPDRGGSIYCEGGLTVRGCTFSDNRSDSEGGVIYNWLGATHLWIENSTFAGNTAGGGAGAVSAFCPEIVLRHVTITGNTSPEGGLKIWQYAAVLQNCLIAGNSTEGLFISGPGSVNLTESHNNILGTGNSLGLQDGVNGNQIGVPASSLRLGPLSNNGGPTPTVALLPGSPALDAGVAGAIATDQRGMPRRSFASGGLLGRYYKLGSEATTGLLSPLSNLEAQPLSASIVTRLVDFGSGTENAPGSGGVLDRDGTNGNPFGGLGISVDLDNFAALWTGYITVPETANYRFTTRSDDGSVLYIGGQLVVSNNNVQPATNANGSVFLTAGIHALRIGYFDLGGAAIMQVSWEQLDGAAPFTRRIIPPEVLSWGSSPDIGAYEHAELPSTALEEWRSLQGLAATGSQDGSSPSGDGVVNLLKFAFNMAPVAGDLAKPNVGIMPAGGSAGLPRITRDGEGRLVIEFVRRKATANPGITYTVETGDLLPGLQPLDLPPATIVPIDTTWERVTFVDPVIGTKRFGRVRVTVW